MSPAPTFDTVCELAGDSGFIGQALRALPEREWLAEADRRPEPWEFLLKIPGMSKDFHMLFRAAQSQRTALRRIAEIARGGGSIEHSWGHSMKQAGKSGDAKAGIHAANKVFASLRRYDGERLLAAAKKDSPAMEAEVRARADVLYRGDCRKLGRTKADKESRSAAFNPETWSGMTARELVWGWLRNRNGAPGYCFFGDKALLQTLDVLLKLPSLEFYMVRKTRRFMGLEKAPIFIHSVKKKNGSFNLLNRRGEVIWNIVLPALHLK